MLGRYAECANEANADIIVRLTGDCPFADPAIIDQVVALRAQTEADYAQNVSPATFPDGLDTKSSLAKLWTWPPPKLRGPATATA